MPRKFPQAPSLLISGLILCVAASPAAHAQEARPAESPQAMYTSLGAFGLSLGYAHRINEHWLARAQLNSGALASAKGQNTVGHVDFDTRVRPGAGLATFTDYYPSMDSGWHVSGGLVTASHMHADLIGTPDGSGHYTIAGHRYSQAEVGDVRGQLKYWAVSPYLGVGWESAPIERQGWRFASDAGLSYNGKPHVDLSASGAASNPALQADLQSLHKDLARQGLTLSLQLGAAHSF